MADALSCCYQSPEVLAISSPVHEWLLELQQWYDTNPDAKARLAHLALQSADSSPFALRNGVIMYKQWIWLGTNSVLKH